MNYLPKSRNRSIYSRKIILLLALFMVGAIFFSFFNSIIISLASPLWRAENIFSRTLGRSFDFFHIKNSLILENEELKARVESLEIRASSGVSGSEQGSVLGLLGRVGEGEAIAAAVLTHPPQSPYDILIIDAGSRDSIVEGARVRLPEGPEIGAVTEVFSNSSRVELFSAPGKRTNAVLERHEVSVVLDGSGAGNFKIIVPRETEVVVGDRVLSPALNAPLLAVVESVEVSPTDSFKEVLAKSPINIFSVRYVLITP